jgi:hypothetical protein
MRLELPIPALVLPSESAWEPDSHSMRLEKFLFCEMARNEANGQVSLVGLHVGDETIVQVPREIPLEIIPNLHCVVILGDMERCRKIRVQLQVQNQGRVLLVSPDQQTLIPTPKKFHNLLFGFAPFPCTGGPGDYEFRVTVQPEGESATTFARMFRIERQAVNATSQGQVRH